MTESTHAVPDSAPPLDLGRRILARQARAESRLAPWTRRDLSGKTIVRELRFAQHIARRVYGRGFPGVTFEGQLSPNAPRGVARFSEKVVERNTLADVARKYAPADDGEAGEAASNAASNAPLPLAGAGSGEAGGPRNAGPAISAAEALQRLAVVRPDLDPDSSPFAKLFKAATGSAQPSESTLQRASSDSARRVVETFQRGGPRPRADSAPPAPIQPRTDRPPAAIQRRADLAASAAPVPLAVTPAPERPPATPSVRALRRFAKVEEVVPANFTPPPDDFVDDLPEPGGPAIQRAIPPVPGDMMPLARRPDAAPTPTPAPATLVQAKRAAQTTAPAPKRPARPAPAPARLQRRAAAPAALQVSQPAPGARPPAPVDRGVELPTLLQGPAADARDEPAARPIDVPSERPAARPSTGIQPKSEGASAVPPQADDRPAASNAPTPAGTELPLQGGPAAESWDTAPAPPDAPIQRETPGASSGDLPLARPARPESPPGDVLQRAPAAGETPGAKSSPTLREPAAAPLDEAPRPRPGARELPEDVSRDATAQRKPAGLSTEPLARAAASATQPAAPIQRTPSEGQTAELPIAREAVPPTDRRPEAGPGPAPAALEPPQLPPNQRQTADTPAAPVQRQTSEDQADDLQRAQPSEPPAAPIQRQPTEIQADDLPLARPSELPAAPPTSPIQRQTNESQVADLPLTRAPEPPAAPPASPILRQAIEDAAKDLPRVRPPETPAAPPAAPIQRPPTQDTAVDLPLVRTQEPAPPPDGPPPAPPQRQLDAGATIALPLIHPPEAAPPSPPAAPIQRQPSDRPTVDLPLTRPPTPESPQPAASAPQSQSKEAGFSSGEAPAKPADIRPRPSALNLARRAVQRMLGEGPQPAAAALGQPEQARPVEGESPPRFGPGEVPAQSFRPRLDFELRRAPAAPIAPEEPGSAAVSGPTTWAESNAGAPRPTPIPARIQRTPAPMPAVARAGRGGEAIAAGPDTDDVGHSFDRDDSLPLVVPLLAAQSQSASRHIQRAEISDSSGASTTRPGPPTAPRRSSVSRPTGYSSEPAPKVGLKPPKPDQAVPAKGNEPDLNYDLLAQRVYPFIRRLLAFERERERGS
ncbi:MAG: hypothetical protein ABIQ99_12025 [Thermoflexales bacterium]